MTENKNKMVESLKEYFKKNPSVVLAFLFGSFAKGFQMEESDVDIAIYLKNYHPIPSPLLSLKKPESVKKLERKIWFELTSLLHKEIDLVCLNEAPASLVSNVFKTGIPLKIGDESLYWELYLSKSLEAEDFLDFLEDFEKIKERARSLTPEAKNCQEFMKRSQNF